MGQIHYQGGHGFEQNYERALRYFQRAADQGNAIALAALGEMHQAGLGTVASNKTVAFFTLSLLCSPTS